MTIMTETLRYIQGMSYQDSEDYTLLCMPRSSIQPYINFDKSI
jgi:hypothetical protein